MLNSFLDKFIFTNGIKYTHNNFYIMDTPFLILPTNILAELAKKEDPEIDKAIYYSSKEAVKKTINDLRINFSAEKEESLKFMTTFFIATGWGKLETVDLDKEACTAIVSATNTPIAATQKFSYPCDSYLRGILAGIFSKYFRKEVDCVEAECIATGRQNCEFVIKPSEKFNFENKLTRRQLELKV